MDQSQPFLKTCGCLSLRASSIYVGIIELLFYALFIVSELAFSILYMHNYEESLSIELFSTLELLLIFNSLWMQFIFGIYLLYGAIWNSPRRSSFTFAWLLLKVAIMFSNFTEIFTNSLSHIGANMFYSDGFIYFFFQMLSCFIVYNWYRTLPASVS